MASTSKVNTQQNKVRNYSIWAHLAHKVSDKVQQRLEILVDADEQLALMRRRKAEVLPAEVLYSHRMSDTKAQVYQHYSEESVMCTTGQVELDLVTTLSKQKLREKHLKNIHLGCVLIGVYGQHREHVGAKVFISLIDTRWDNLTKGVIGQMEIDIHNNQELV